MTHGNQKNASLIFTKYGDWTEILPLSFCEDGVGCLP